MTDRKLVCVDIVAGRTLYSRTVYTEYEPTPEDLNFYYKELCGLTDAVVTSSVITVPADFNQALVAFSEQIPTRFPNYDITAKLEEADKIVKYHDYINQMSQMEMARAALKVHITTAATAPNGGSADGNSAGTPTVAEPKRPMLRRHGWVREILQALESEEEPICDDIVPVEQDNFIPHAWILTPVLASVRNEWGSRILMNAVKGKHWERLLGSSLFPDFVVSRRISTHNWLFQHDTADDLLRATLNFYIASQDAKMVCGLSSWIPAAEKEFNLLMRTFKKIKVNERMMAKSDDPTHIFNILNNIEVRCLVSKAEDPAIHPLNIHIFRKYVNYVGQALGVPYEKYNTDGVTQILRRWEQSEFGFRADVEPVVPAWGTVWNLITAAAAPTVEQVALFLATLDTWNPHEANLLSRDQLDSIAEQWVEIFVKKETVPVADGFEIVLVLCDETRRWCLQYLPAVLFEKILKTERLLTGVYTKFGYNMTRSHIYKKMTGVKLLKPSNKTVFEGKVVDKAPNIPEPQLWKVHHAEPKKMPEFTKNGKIRGRRPKEGTPISKMRQDIILNMMREAGVDVKVGVDVLTSAEPREGDCPLAPGERDGKPTTAAAAEGDLEADAAAESSNSSISAEGIEDEDEDENELVMNLGSI